MLFENSFCSLIYCFLYSLCFLEQKKTGNQTRSPRFPYFSLFLDQKTVFKNRIETFHSFWIKMCLVTPKVLVMIVL